LPGKGFGGGLLFRRISSDAETIVSELKRFDDLGETMTRRGFLYGLDTDCRGRARGPHPGGEGFFYTREDPAEPSEKLWKCRPLSGRSGCPARKWPAISSTTTSERPTNALPRTSRERTERENASSSVGYGIGQSRHRRPPQHQPAHREKRTSTGYSARSRSPTGGRRAPGCLGSLTPTLRLHPERTAKQYAESCFPLIGAYCVS